MSSNACSRVGRKFLNSFSELYLFFTTCSQIFFSDRCVVMYCLASPKCARMRQMWLWMELAGLGWAGLRLECGGWWRLADLGGRGVLVSVQSTVARVPPHSTQEPDAWCRAPSSTSAPATQEPAQPLPASRVRPAPAPAAPPLWWHTSLAAKSRPAPAPSTDSSTSSVISSVLCLLHLFTPLLQVSPTPPSPAPPTVLNEWSILAAARPRPAVPATNTTITITIIQNCDPMSTVPARR